MKKTALILAMTMLAISMALTGCGPRSTEDLIKDYEALGKEAVAAIKEDDMDRFEMIQQEMENVMSELQSRDLTYKQQRMFCKVSFSIMREIVSTLEFADISTLANIASDFDIDEMGADFGDEWDEALDQASDEWDKALNEASDEFERALEEASAEFERAMNELDFSISDREVTTTTTTTVTTTTSEGTSSSSTSTTTTEPPQTKSQTQTKSHAEKPKKNESDKAKEEMLQKMNSSLKIIKRK